MLARALELMPAGTDVLGTGVPNAVVTEGRAVKDGTGERWKAELASGPGLEAEAELCSCVEGRGVGSKVTLAPPARLSRSNACGSGGCCCCCCCCCCLFRSGSAAEGFGPLAAPSFMQRRSLVAVGGESSISPSAHREAGAHTRSEVAVGLMTSNDTPARHMVVGRQALCALFQNVPVGHCDTSRN